MAMFFFRNQFFPLNMTRQLHLWTQGFFILFFLLLSPFMLYLLMILLQLYLVLLSVPQLPHNLCLLFLNHLVLPLLLL